MGKLTGLEFTLQFDRKVDIDERGSDSGQIQIMMDGVLYGPNLYSPYFYLNDCEVCRDTHEMSATSLKDDPTKIRVVLNYIDGIGIPLLKKRNCSKAVFREFHFSADSVPFSILSVSDLCFEIDYEKVQVSNNSTATKSINKSPELIIDAFDDDFEDEYFDDDFDKID